MRDLEAEMAKALEGQFFWEMTTFKEPQVSPEQLQLRRVQEKVRDKKTLPKKDKIDPNGEVINLIERLKVAICAEWHISMLDLASRSTSKYTATPKNHYMWCCVRYFPQYSLMDLGKYAGRHYTTLIHGRDAFEFELHLHEDKVRRIDEFMGYR